jgi:hypothetical protein
MESAIAELHEFIWIAYFSSLYNNPKILEFGFGVWILACTVAVKI